jgi:nucleoside-diphosphate-sugar epimerase
VGARASAVVVTGAAGLIGSAVTLRLAEAGWRVVAVDDFSVGQSRTESPQVAWEVGDVADPVLLARLERHAPSVVIHCAAHPGGRSLEEPTANVRVNALGSMTLFEWCARSGVTVAYLSSSAVYGEQPPAPIPETAEVRPGTVYAVCKVACEGFLRVLGEGHGLPWTALRLFATYGAGHRPSTHQGIVNVMLTQLLAGNKVVVRGPLDRVRDLLEVEDAARAIVDCALQPATRGLVLNVGSGAGVTVRGVIEVLCAVLGRRWEDLDVVEAAPTVGDPHYSVSDVSRLRAAVGFAPQSGLHEGLARLVEARLGAAA